MSQRKKDDNGRNPGWTGHLQNRVEVASSQLASFDPPLRGISCTGGTTVRVVLNGDVDADDNGSLAVTLTLEANKPETRFAIGKVLPGGSATGLVGFR